MLPANNNAQRHWWRGLVPALLLETETHEPASTVPLPPIHALPSAVVCVARQGLAAPVMPHAVKGVIAVVISPLFASLTPASHTVETEPPPTPIHAGVTQRATTSTTVAPTITPSVLLPLPPLAALLLAVAPPLHTALARVTPSVPLVATAALTTAVRVACRIGMSLVLSANKQSPVVVLVSSTPPPPAPPSASTAQQARSTISGCRATAQRHAVSLLLLLPQHRSSPLGTVVGAS